MSERMMPRLVRKEDIGKPQEVVKKQAAAETASSSVAETGAQTQKPQHIEVDELARVIKRNLAADKAAIDERKIEEKRRFIQDGKLTPEKPEVH